MVHSVGEHLRIDAQWKYVSLHASVDLPFHVTTVSARLWITWSRAHVCTSPMLSIWSWSQHHRVRVRVFADSVHCCFSANVWTLRCAPWSTIVDIDVATFASQLSASVQCTQYPSGFSPILTTSQSLCWLKSLCGMPTCTMSAFLICRLSWSTWTVMDDDDHDPEVWNWATWAFIVSKVLAMAIANLERVKLKLDKMVQDRELAKVEESAAWCSNMTVVERVKPQSSVKTHLCLDPSQTNKKKKQQSHCDSQD